MTHQKKRRLIIGIIIVVAIGTGLLWFLVRRFLTDAFVIDYIALPGPETFQMVLRQPTPEDISELSAIGHGFGQGHSVWMRFRLTPGTLDDVLAKLSTEKMTAEEFAQSAKAPFESNTNKEDELRVSWEKIPKIEQPEFYRFNETKNGEGWFGAIAVDRGNNTVYIYASAL